jgi:hypothetical protein
MKNPPCLFSTCQEPRKRKACGCGSCCMVSLLAFLLIFFFLPRTPTMYLHKVNYDGDSQSATGMFKFHNENYFKVDWSDAAVALYWMPASGTAITTQCSGSTTDANAACVYLGHWKTQCAIKIGEFSDDSEFTTKAQEHTSRDLALTQSTQQKQCMANMAVAALAQGEQTLYSKGSVHAKGQYRNFHKVSIDGTYYY